ncbi:hypothetical protein [Actinomadura montaniterrae]|uniref:Uncharacterized protein n=1 Tax=Actinomadura montaniterrae TaxID=1803903 RepID=A0A6L3VMU9_9ACTN|nr:hypothetical protein [Actinomadura montaniterrae]KAB2369598.1 hypothetical protein F9B16_36680 [Actinomadura montaniterrae]
MITFSLDEHYRLPLFEVEDERHRPLAAWITTDISIYKRTCLDALAVVADLVAGRPPFEEWSSENYEVEFGSRGLRFQNLWVPDERGAYTLPEVKEAVKEYWRFLASIPDDPDLIREYRPDLPERQAALLRWEETWKRRHPYRGTLF